MQGADFMFAFAFILFNGENVFDGDFKCKSYLFSLAIKFNQHFPAIYNNKSSIFFFKYIFIIFTKVYNLRIFVEF